MSYKQQSPIPISEGGTNVTSLTDIEGVIIYNGTGMVTVNPGIANRVLTSNGPLLPPTFQAISSSGAITTINGNSGSVTPTTGAVSIVGSGGITTSGSGSTLTITGSGTAVTWNNVTGTTQAMAVNNGYVSNAGASLVTFTLPTTAAIGDEVSIMGSGSGLFTIAQNSGQTIHANGGDSTTGVGGTVSSSGQYDSITLRCNVANTDFVLYRSTGNFNFV